MVILSWYSKFWTRDRPGDGIKEFTSPDILESLLASHKTEESGVKERLAFESQKEEVIEIPGLEDDLAGVVHLADDDDEEEEEEAKNRSLPNRPPGSISKEFMANWSSSRNLSKPGVVLSAVAAAKENSIREAVGAATNRGNIEDEEAGVGSGEGGPMEVIDTSRIVATPVVTSDMCMNPKAKAAASEAEEYDTAARFKGRKFDSAVREEEMLAFANSLMPPSPPALQQPPPPASSVPPSQETSHPSMRQPPPQSQPPNQPPINSQPPPRFGPPQRFMSGPPPPPGGGYRSGGPVGGGYPPPPGAGGAPPMPFRRPPMPFRPFDQQWGGPGPYNGPPPGYGGPPPPNKRPRRGW